MLKHATICRTSRAQQTLQLQRQCNQQLEFETDQVSDDAVHHQDDNNNLEDDTSLRTPSPSPSPLLAAFRQHVLAASQSSPAGSTSSLPFISSKNRSFSNISSRLPNLSSLPTTPVKHHKLNTSNSANNQCNSQSMIRVFAQTLSQDVEYITLHVNTQTKSQQIVKSLLKKFRLKHRDPNLFYLTLERWIRKDGLKCKSVMLLSDEACPMQLAQCCSNPPYEDIKFTLQMRAGALVKIYCSDVVPDARYKCLSLSTQTTVEETIVLILHCLNLTTNATAASHTLPIRNSSSPSSTGSTNSSNSSSSGIESDLPTSTHTNNASLMSRNQLSGTHLTAESRTSSITSIESTSNLSTLSATLTDQYCLIIECKDSNYRRILEPNEYLVDVYQSLLLEAKDQQQSSMATMNNNNESLQSNQQPFDQWFFIKLKRRHEFNHQNELLHSNMINFISPRHNTPLPPIPSSLSHSNNLQSIVSTTQIEIKRRPSSSLAALSGGEMCKPLSQQQDIITTTADLSALANNKCPPPPAVIVLPPIRPRRRNLSNASSTFTAPRTSTINRRRYDPAQLEADLSKLDLKQDTTSMDVDEETKRESIVIDNSTITNTRS